MSTHHCNAACERVGCDTNSKDVTQNVTQGFVSSEDESATTCPTCAKSKQLIGATGFMCAISQLEAERDGLYADLLGMEHRLGTQVDVLKIKLRRYEVALEEIARLDQGKSAWLARRALNWEEK